jgi:hypothetical protein
MNVFSCLEFAAHLRKMESELPKVEEKALEAAAANLEAKIKSLIGTYSAKPRWKEIAEYTKEDRSRKGFTPNDPLLRTGALRDSIHHKVVDKVAYVGSDSDILVYQQLGTARIPPRAVFGNATVHKALKKEAKQVGKTIANYLSHGNMHSLDSGILHLLRHALHDTVDMVKDLLSEPDEQ